MVKTLIALLVLSCSVQALAQLARDPTQPPAAYSADSELSAPDAGEAEVQRPVLHSIIRRHGAKPLAVINGETLGIGGRIGDWVVVRIGESEVVLKGSAERQTLTLSPDVEKRPVKAAVARELR